MVGTGTRHRGLWYMDKRVQPDLAYAATMEDKEKHAMIHHYRMGHVSFDKMSRIFPDGKPHHIVFFTYTYMYI